MDAHKYRNFRSHFANFFANLHIFCEKKLSMKMRNYARFHENTMSVVAIITINCTKKNLWNSLKNMFDKNVQGKQGNKSL